MGIVENIKCVIYNLEKNKKMLTKINIQTFCKHSFIA